MSRMIERLNAWQDSGASAFRYDAAEATNKRRPPSGKTYSEDAVLPMGGRSKLQSSARDLNRNFALTGWMIRRHQDYIVPHSFHCRTEDEGFNREFEAAVSEWSEPAECEYSGRFSLCELSRIAEGCATVDGDFGFLKLDNGKLQGVESDRIQNPEKESKAGNWINGVKTVSGVPTAYGIWGRTADGKSLEFEREVASQALFLHGYFGRVDQFRGVSPLAAGLNSIQDTHEGISLALAKLKVEQLFALAIYRDAMESAGELDYTAATDEDGEEVNKAGYVVDFGKGPQLIDLEPGDKAEFLHANSPGSDAQAFLLSVIMVSLKALDIPYSFYDEKHTNFFGSRAAWLHYERSCKPKRERVRRFLNHWTVWRTQVAMRRGFRIPASVTLAKPFWEWVPEGMPWWNPSQEIKGDSDAILNGFSTPQRVVRERGTGDFIRNIEDTGRAIQHARKHGVILPYDVEGMAKIKAASAPAPEGKPEAPADDQPERDDEGEKRETQDDQ